MSKKAKISIFVLIVVYGVGIIGLSSAYQSHFLLLTPFNLLFSLGMIIWNYEGKYKKAGKVVLVSYLVGFLLELVGVQTGLLFGEYAYGEVLGPKIAGTPLMIGINWALLILGAGSLVNLLLEKQSIFIKTVAGACSMVALDLLIEPVAIHLGFWDWKNGTIPLQNYLAWFGISLLLQFWHFWTFKNYYNKVAIIVFLLQFVFFGMMTLSIE